MDSELDRTFNPFERNDEFEAWLDEMCYRNRDEWAEIPEQDLKFLRNYLTPKFNAPDMTDDDVPF